MRTPNSAGASGEAVHVWSESPSLRRLARMWKWMSALVLLALLAVLAWVALDVPPPATTSSGGGAIGETTDGEESSTDEAPERLERGGSPSASVAEEDAQLVGRVILGGKPVAGASVVLRESAVSLDADTELEAGNRPFSRGVLQTPGGPRLVRRRHFGRAIQSMVTDEAGEFAVGELAAGEYLVSAEDDGGRVASRVVTIDEPGTPVFVLLSLAAGAHELQVRILRADGETFRGSAGLRHFPAFGPASPAQWRDVDGEGGVHFVGVASPWVQVTCSGADGWVEVSEPIRLPQDGEWVWRLGRGLRSIPGRVTDGDTGAGLPGATIRVHDELGARATTAGPGGEFTMPVADRASIRISADGYAPRELTVGLDSERADIALVRHASVAGRVLSDTDANPVVGTTVWAGDWSDPTTPRATTDALGRFRIDGVTPGRRRLRVRGDGWISRQDFGRASGRDVEADATSVVPVTLFAVRAGRLLGRVLDPEGRPVQGAEILLDVSWTGKSADRRRAVSAADGSFVVTGLDHASNPMFVCRAEGYPILREKIDRIPGDGREEQLEIRLEAPHHLSVKVVSAASGEPVVGAVVDIRRVDGSLGHHVVAQGLTGVDGRARVGPVAPRRSWVRVQAPGYAPEVVDEDPLDPTTPVTVRLEPGVSLSGRVLRDGRPVANAPVGVIQLGTARQVFTDTAGRFSVGALGPVGGAVFVRHRGRRASLEFDTPPAEVELVLQADEEREQPTRRAGTQLLVSSSSGKPVGSFRLAFFERRSTGWASSTSITRGMEVRLHWRKDYPSREVLVLDPRDAFGRRLPVRAIRRKVPDPPPEVLEVRLPTETPTYRGRVVRGDGSPVGGVVVHVLASGPDGGPYAAASTLDTVPVDDDGRFAVSGVALPQFHLLAEPEGGGAVSDYVRVEEGAGEIELVLPESPPVTLHVVDQDGGLVAGVQVIVRRHWSSGSEEPLPPYRTGGGRDEDPWYGRSTGEAPLVATGLRSDAAYRLDVRLPDGYVTDWDARAEWTPADTTILARRSGALAGTVFLTSGAPAVGARVSLDDGERWTLIDEDGTFEIDELVAGREYTVVATLEGGTRSARTTARPGDAVGLSIDPGPHLRLRVADRSLLDGLRPELSLVPPATEAPLMRPRLRDGLVLAGLDPATLYTLLVLPDATFRELGNDADAFALRIDGVPGDAGEIDVTPRPAAIVPVQVRPPDGWGGNLGLLEVHLALGEQRVAEAASGRDRSGSYELVGVPEGEWTVVVIDRANRSRELARVPLTVPRGTDEPLVITWE